MTGAVGEALYGPRWQTEMARALDKAKRTVQRYDAGDAPVPDDVVAALVPMVAGRMKALEAIMRRLGRGR